MKIHTLILVFALTLITAWTQAQQPAATQERAGQQYVPRPVHSFLFKTIPPVSHTDPEWVQMLYSDTPNIFELEKAYAKYYRTHVFEKNTHTQNYRYFMRQIYAAHYYTEDGNLHIPTDSERRMAEAFMKEKRELLAAQEQASSRMANWQCIGPFQTYSGEGTYTGKVSKHTNVYQVAQAASNPNIMYCASEGGRIFKSTDKGQNWTSVGDQLTFYSPEALEVDPNDPDIVYLGTRHKLYKTSNGGTNWTILQNITDLKIYSIAIHKANPQIVLTAGVQGLQRSTDGGTSWTTILTDQCWDLAFNTGNPDVVYVAKSNPTKNITEIWKSTDAGQNFSPITNGWFNPVGGVAQSEGGARIAVTDADPNRIYVILLGEENDGINDNNYIGIYRSDNGGTSWYTPYDGDGDGNPDNEPGGPYSENHWCFTSFHPWFAWGGYYNQGFYDLDIAASDTDPDVLLAGSLNLFKSTDGGITYEGWGGYFCPGCPSGSPSRHPDIQDIDMNGNDVWVANDGGIDYYDAALNYLEPRHTGISGAGYWGFAQGWNDDVITGGRYHNGNGARHEGYAAGDFLALGGGEAPTGYVNQGDNFEVQHSDISGKRLPASIPQAATNIPKYSMFPNESYFPNNKSEIVSDPRCWNILYLGKDQKLWKSTDGGNSFSVIGTFGSSSDDIVLGIEVARSNPDVIYVVQRGNKVWKTTNGGNSWTQLSLPASTNHMYISVDLENENIIYLALDNGYTNPNKVFKSTDGGNTWTNLSSSMLDGEWPKAIQAQGGTNGGVYVVTTGGVYYRNNTHSDWQAYSTGLPAKFNYIGFLPFYRDEKLRLATDGQAIWETSFYETSNPVAQPMASALDVFCARDTVQFESYSIASNSATYQWSFSPAPQWVSSTNTRNPKVVFGTTGSYSVTLTITDGGISHSKIISNMITVNAECDPENVPGNAMSLTAAGDYMQLPDLNLNTNTITFTAWIKPNGPQSSYCGIIMSDNSSISGMNLRNNEELGFHWQGSQWWWSSGLIVPQDQWSHVAMVVSPSGITMYLNGIAATNSYTVPVSQMNTMKVGSYQGWSSRNFKGLIEEVCIFNRALTASEIREYMHLTAPSVNDPDLIHYYQFNRTNGLVMDRKGIAHGSLSGNATRTISTAPTGPGVRSSMNVSAAGQYTFGSTGITLDFPSGGVLPNGDLVATRIDIAPDQQPGNNPTPANRYWIIHNFGSNATFAELNSIQFSDLSNITTTNNGSEYELYKRSSTADGASWNSPIDMADAATTTSLTFSTGNGITSFSQFAIDKGAVPLPVELAEFSVQADAAQRRVLVSWQVKNAFNGNYFAVERSADGKSFEELSRIQDQGSFASYQWVDQQPLEGLSYYRLRQADQDGTGTFSPVRPVFLPPIQEIKVYPNPLSGEQALTVQTNGPLPLRFELFDAEGRQLTVEILHKRQNRIPLRHLPKGTYFYRITSPTYMTFGKIERLQ